MTIHKLELIEGTTIHAIEGLSRILSASEQNQGIVVHYEIDEQSYGGNKTVEFLVVNTGRWYTAQDGKDWTFVDTVSVLEGKEKWHVFYRMLN